ncbi:hypothetical protein [Vibrio vulnificus YJ016]|uniref:Uncharacterized protein n=1 Tax=Vibrio vulnificus (strain YJ016) TaxID=196600 RepID=Q7MBW5_VIBVY|nr:hypothetical protein [Vibrio vulnificus YJ016]
MHIDYLNVIVKTLKSNHSIQILQIKIVDNSTRIFIDIGPTKVVISENWI